MHPPLPPPSPQALTLGPGPEAGAVGLRGPAFPTLGGGGGSVPGPHGISAGVCFSMNEGGRGGRGGAAPKRPSGSAL